MDSGRKKVVVGIGVLLVLALIVGIIHSRRAVPIVPVITVGYAPFAIELPESGVVQYPQVQTMSSEIAGNIGHVFVKTGEWVIAGQRLVTIENPEIIAAAQSSEAAYHSATARAESAEVTGSSNVVQAEASLEAARARLAQAQQDLANGLQSGLGYGETTATAVHAQADANLTTATTALREARRIYIAYRDLYANKAVSRDQLDQAEAKYEEAQVSHDQALSQRSSLGSQLIRSRVVLADNLRSAQEGFAQAAAQLSAARVESGSGDVAAAQAGAARAGSEYALARGAGRCDSNSRPIRRDGLERRDRKDRSAPPAPAGRRRCGGSTARDARRATSFCGADESGRAGRTSMSAWASTCRLPARTFPTGR